MCVENRDKAQREAAFYSAGACENTTPRESRKYSNTRVSRRQPLGSVVTCPVIYGCNTAATLLFVVFTHISRSPAGRDRNASARARSRIRNTAGWGAAVISVNWNTGETRKREKRREELWDGGRGGEGGGNESRSEVRALFMMLSPKAAALSDRGFCQSTIALPVPYVALISSEGIVPPSNATLHIVSFRDAWNDSGIRAILSDTC